MTWSLTACTISSEVTTYDAGPRVEEAVGQDVTVAVFTEQLVDADHRTIAADVDFPELGRYEKITLVLSLSCPGGTCDYYDRLGSVSLVDDATGNDPELEIELLRFITPFRLAARFEADVTELRSLLRGPKELRVFIDTWVRQGSDYGNGWLVDAYFEFVGGTPLSAEPMVVPLWNQFVTVGDPNQPTETQLLPQPVTLPEHIRTVVVRSMTTGHGQGNADNCAEFCPQEHILTIGQKLFADRVWRDDCETTAVQNQPGTWQYARAGWCPGAIVHPKYSALESSSFRDLQVRYDFQPYENTCRPDAIPCAGCTLGPSCDYDGGAHTEPRFRVSAVLLGYP